MTQIPILENPVISSEKAKEQQLLWASREALLNHEQARTSAQMVATDIPEEWIEEAVQEALQAHLDPIIDSVLNRLQMRCAMSGKTLKSKHQKESEDG